MGSTCRPVLPWMSVRYFAIFIVCLASLVAVVELRLWMLAKEGRVVSNEWQVENDAINRMNEAKIKSTHDDPLWRSDGIPPPGSKGGKQRILVVGDSFVWGDGYINANEIWWRQLERELQRRGYFDVEVIAIGERGASTQDELRWLRDLRLLEKLDPDIVVLGYVTNDPDTKRPDGTPFIWQAGLYPANWTRLDRTLGRVAPRLTAQIKEQLHRKWESKLVNVYPYAEWELKLLEPPNVGPYREVVRQLGELIHASGKGFIAVTLPNYPSAEHFVPRHRGVPAIFAAAALRFHDLLDDFLLEYPSTGEVLQWGVNSANGHPGPVSTRFYARKVSDLLERDFRSALGPRHAGPRKLNPSINDWMPPSANVRHIQAGEWELSYPTNGSLAPKLPFAKPHVMLAFAQPVAIRRIIVSGQSLNGAELHVTVVDPVTRVEQKQDINLGAKTGKSLEWSLVNRRNTGDINTLKLAAEFDADARQASARSLHLRVDFAEVAVRP